MFKNVSFMQRFLPNTSPWVTIAAVLALVLLAYYVFLGMEFRKFSDEETALSNRVSELLTEDRPDLSLEEALSLELESLEQRLEGLQGLFTYPGVDDLVAGMYASAQEAQVQLISVSVDDLQEQSIGTTRYEVQPIALEFRAGTADTLNFLSLVHERLPMADLSSINLQGIQGDPLVSVELLFYGSPEAITQEEEAS